MRSLPSRAQLPRDSPACWEPTHTVINNPAGKYQKVTYPLWFCVHSPALAQCRGKRDMQGGGSNPLYILSQQEQKDICHHFYWTGFRLTLRVHSCWLHRKLWCASLSDFCLFSYTLISKAFCLVCLKIKPVSFSANTSKRFLFQRPDAWFYKNISAFFAYELPNFTITCLDWGI